MSHNSGDDVCPHDYVPSRVGHGEAQCRWCHGTNRENAILAPNHCESRAKDDLEWVRKSAGLPDPCHMTDSNGAGLAAVTQVDRDDPLRRLVERAEQIIPDYQVNWHEAARQALTRPDQIASPAQPGESFQVRVDKWMDACFGDQIKADRLERCDRCIEEVLELVQTEPTFTAERAHALVDYVFGRPVGDPAQEVGGVKVTLAALCNTFEIDVDIAAETELARVWTKVEAIRAKQARKPTGSALPIAAEQAAPAQPGAELVPHETGISQEMGRVLNKALLASFDTTEPAVSTVPHETGEALVERVARAIDPNLWALFDDPRWFMPNNVNDIAMRKGSLARARRALSAIPEPAVSIAELVEALELVEGAMLRGGDGKPFGYGWNITKLNAARPRIHAALDKAKSQGGAE